MSVYVVPQVLVYQEIESVPAVDIRPLPAHISGPHAHLIRYAAVSRVSEHAHHLACS